MFAMNMKNFMRTGIECFFVWIPILGFALTLTTRVADAQTLKTSGYAFGDYYYVGSSHDADLEGRNGVWFRRIYLTFDQSIAEGWSARLRTEMGQPGDFSTKAKMEPFVKDVYLKWSREGHQVFIGLSGTPTWGLVEKMWGYRAVEKTALDLYKFGSSRDIGIAAKGKLNAEGTVKYHVMLANGGGTSSEVNEGKKAMLSLAVSPATDVTLEVYADFEDLPGETDRHTFQGSMFVKKKKGRVGLQFARHTRMVEGRDNDTFDVLSVFGAVVIDDKLSTFFRYDRQFQINPSAEKIAYLPFASAAEANFVVGGLDFAVTDAIRFMPNVEVVFYSNSEGETPDPDVLPRVTFFYRF
jgi:hypothetical protein